MTPFRWWIAYNLALGLGIGLAVSAAGASWWWAAALMAANFVGYVEGEVAGPSRPWRRALRERATASAAARVPRPPGRFPDHGPANPDHPLYGDLLDALLDAMRDGEPVTVTHTRGSTRGVPVEIAPGSHVEMHLGASPTAGSSSIPWSRILDAYPARQA